MTRTELENKVSNGDYDSEYAEYIMENCGGDRIICNGDTLLKAMEDGYLFEEFCDSLETKLENSLTN